MIQNDVLLYRGGDNLITYKTRNDVLLKYMSENGLNQSQVAVKCNLSSPTLHNMLQKNNSVSNITAVKVAKGLNMQLKDLFEITIKKVEENEN